MKLTALWAALAVGNLLYAAIADHNWATAIDRSWWQAVAIFAVWILA